MLYFKVGYLVENKGCRKSDTVAKTTYHEQLGACVINIVIHWLWILGLVSVRFLVQFTSGERLYGILK